MMPLHTLLKFLGLRRRAVLFYLFLTQDLDMLLPIMRSLQARGTPIEALLHSHVLKNSPRTQTMLQKYGIEFAPQPASTWRSIFYLLRFSALVTAADTTAKAHYAGHRMVRFANWLGVRTFTFQHGLENIGLTYYDEEFPPSAVDFASRKIFIWGEADRLDPRVPQKIRERCIATGCPKEYRLEEVPDVQLPSGWSENLVVVFENLHWGRYDDTYRKRFVDDLEQAALARPDLTILIKPHHAGQWLTKHYQGHLPSSPNLIIADPKDPKWEPFTAPALIKVARAVITTPSTTAIDAAFMGKPVGVVGYNISLPVYEPLPIIKDLTGWLDFLKNISSPSSHLEMRERGQKFKDYANLPGPAEQRVTENILQTI